MLRLLFMVLLLIAPDIALAQGSVAPVIAGDSRAGLQGHMEALYDPTGDLTLADILAGRAGQAFELVPESYGRGLGNTGAAWIRFTLEIKENNNSGIPAHIMMFNPPGMDRISIYIANSPAASRPDDFQRFDMGASLPYAARPLPAPSFLVPLPQEPGKRLVFVRVQNRASLLLHGSVETPQSLRKYELFNWLFSGGYLSACLIVAGINFAFWYWLRERYYLFYAAFTLSLATITIWKTGLLPVLFPNSAHEFHLQFLAFANGMSLFWGLAFAADFLPFKHRAPLAWWLTWGIALTGLAQIIIGAIGLWDKLFAPLAVLGVVMAIIPLIAAIRLARQGNNRSRIYLLSFTPSNLGVFVVVARNLNWLPTNALVDHALQIGGVLHLIIMTVALASRINRSERAKHQAEREALIAAQSSERRANEIAEERTRDLNRAKADLEDALKTERRVSREQMQFIDTVSHEYRTPVAVLRGNLDLLKIAQKKADPVPAAPLKRMHEAIIRLTEIIEVSLQRDRLSGDPIELSPLPLDARQLVDEAVQIARSAYPGHEVNLVQRSGSGDLIIPADAPLLKTALINLVENALKYSPDNAPVEITLALSEADMVSITIADHGIGIQPKDQPFIFDKYYRAANATGRSGAGVGLYLVRVIVTAHGGNVMVASSPQGSQFTVTLPLAQTTNGAT